MAALREVVAQFDVRVEGAQKLDDVDRKLNKAKDSANKSIISFGKLGAALAGAFAIREIAGFLDGQAKLGRELEHQSRATGLSVEQLQRWQYAANQAGIGSEELTMGLNRFNRAIGMTGTEQGKSISQALGKMGINARDANGKIKDTNELLLEFSDGISKLKSPQERMAMAMEIAGRGGAKFAAILGKGRKATEEMLKSADATGGVLGRDFVDAAKKAEEGSVKLEWSWRGLKAAVAQELFPWMSKIVDWVAKFVRGFIDVVKHTTFAKTAFIALGAAIAIANWEIIAIVAAVGAAYAIFDDFFNLFSGNKSYIGDTIDQLSGVGTAAEWVKDLKDAWENLTEAIFGSGDAADQAGESMSFVGVLKATITQVVLVVGAALATIANALAVVIQTARSAWNAITGDEKGQRAADQGQYKAVQALGKSFDDLGTFGSGSNIKSANEMTPEEWYNLNHFSKMKQRKAISTTRDTVDAKTGKVNHVEIHNHINATGGDPKKVHAAVKQGTSDALSQNDLRHAHQASRSQAPPVGGESFVP